MPISPNFTSLADRFVADLNDDYILDFLGGNDQLFVRAGTVVAEMGAGNDYVRVDAGSVRLYGQDGADRFDTRASGSRINAGDGNDVLNIMGGSNHVFTGRSGDDRFNFVSDTAGVRIAGDDGNDLFVGYSRSIGATLHGGNGNDRFLDFGNHDGRAVVLHGGAGNDFYRIDAGSPATIVENAGEGTDTIHLTGGAQYVSYTLGANIETLSAAAVSASVETMYLEGNSLNNRIYGAATADVIQGMAGNDRIYGGAGSDTLTGGDGHDRITGGLGLDWIETGSGRDVIVYESVEDASEFGMWGGEGILDWDAMDRIDLSALDANSEIAGRQPFEYAGSYFGSPVPFTGAGTLTISGFGGELYILGYTDSDEFADFVLSLWSPTGESALSADNLIL